MLLATGGNKRGDGSPVKSSAQENGLKLGGGGLVDLARLRVKSPRRLPAQSRCASAFGAALTSSGEVTLDALAAYRFCSHLWVLARCPNDLVCPQSRLPMPRMLFNKGFGQQFGATVLRLRLTGASTSRRPLSFPPAASSNCNILSRKPVLPRHHSPRSYQSSRTCRSPSEILRLTPAPPCCRISFLTARNARTSTSKSPFS